MRLHTYSMGLTRRDAFVNYLPHYGMDYRDSMMPISSWNNMYDDSSYEVENDYNSYSLGSSYPSLVKYS